MMRELRLLKIHALFSTIAIVLVLTMGAGDSSPSQTFDKITVRQIDVVDSKDRVRVQLAGEFGPRRTELAGLLFHNEDGNEAGGFVFSGKKGKDGKVQAGASLTFDQYGEDQIMAIQYAHDGDSKRNGLTITDRPDQMGEHMARFYRDFSAAKTEEERQRLQKEVLPTIPKEELPAKRLYLGRTTRNSSTVNLYDPLGRVRLTLEVDKDGVPKIEFFDEAGKSVKKISID